MVAGAPTWAGMLPVFVVFTALAFGPGWLVLRFLGVRGLLAVAVSPAVSTGLIAAGGTVAHLLGAPWGWLTLTVATVLSAVVARLVSLGVRRLPERMGGRAPGPPPASGPRAFARACLDPALATVIGAMAALVTIVPTLGGPDELVDAPDAVFHLSRIRLFLETGNFAVTNDTFYPNGFHAWVATGLQTGLADIVAGTNVATLVLAALVWPVGCIALVRTALGPSRLVTYAAGFASAALVAFPTLLLGWGVLWPNLMATAFTPGVLALLLRAARWGRARDLALWLGVIASLPGLALTQPNSLVALAGFALVLVVAGRVAAGAARRTPWRIVVRDLGVGAVAVASGLVLAPVVSRGVAVTQSYRWADHVTPATALTEVIGGRLLTGVVFWGPVLLLPIGITWIVLRARAAVPLVVMWLVCIAAYVAAASSTAGWTSLVTGYWYNDKVRLASLAAVPGVVLIAAAAPALRLALLRLRPLRRRPFIVALVALVVLPLLTLVWSHEVRRDLLISFYRPSDPTHVILSDAGRRDLAALAAVIPAGDGVVGRPENGSPLMFALFGTNTLYRRIPIPPTGDQLLIGTGFSQLTTRPSVCAALARHRVRWAVDSPHVYWVDRPAYTSGLFDLSRVEGVEPVKTVGAYTLYRITGCP